MNKQQLSRDITSRVMDPWPLFWYTLYIQSLSMFIQTLSFLAFLGSEKSVTKIFKNGKIWKPSKGHNSMSYGLLATILPIHLPYLETKCGISFIEVGPQTFKLLSILIFWKSTKGRNSKSYKPLAPIPVYTIHPVIVHVYTTFQLSHFHSSWEICYESFQEWQKLKTYQGTAPRVMGPWPPFCQYTFLTLETKCGISFIKVWPQTLKLLSKMHFNFLKTYQRK